MDELPVEIKRQILMNQISQYKGSIYLTEITHKVNKRLGNADKLEQLEKELVRLNKEMDAFQQEFDALKDEK